MQYYFFGRPCFDMRTSDYITVSIVHNSRLRESRRQTEHEQKSVYKSHIV